MHGQGRAGKGRLTARQGRVDTANIQLQGKRLQKQGTASWSGRVEIRLADIKLVTTKEAPAIGGRPVIIIGFVKNILSLLACVKYWAGHYHTAQCKAEQIS